MIRVVLPAHLRNLARVEDEITLAVAGPVTQRSVLDALEASFPPCGAPSATTARNSGGPSSGFSVVPRISLTNLPDTPLPEKVADGTEPFLVVGAIAGG